MRIICIFHVGGSPWLEARALAPFLGPPPLARGDRFVFVPVATSAIFGNPRNSPPAQGCNPFRHCACCSGIQLRSRRPCRPYSPSASPFPPCALRMPLRSSPAATGAPVMRWRRLALLRGEYSCAPLIEQVGVRASWSPPAPPCFRLDIYILKHFVQLAVRPVGEFIQIRKQE